MKVGDIINEDNFNDDGDPTVENILNTIKRDCDPYLSMINRNLSMYPIYRGVYRHNYGTSIERGFWQYQTNQFRKPKDMPLSVHQYIDNWFLNKFGIKYRSQAVFGTGSMMLAAEYGSPHMMLPIGNFNFCWTPILEDLYKEFDGADAMYGQEAINKWMSSLQYRQNDNLKLAIESGNEIMISCDEYYLLNASLARIFHSELSSL